MTKGANSQTRRADAARRQARYRVRQILGIRLIRAEVDLALLEDLIDAGHLPERISEDTGAIAQALVAAARKGCNAQP